MADDKKGGKGDKKKEGGGGGSSNQTELIIGLLFLVMAGSVVIERVNNFFASDTTIKGIPQNFYEKFLSVAPILQIISVIVSGLLLFFILLVGRKIGMIRKAQRLALYPSGEIDAGSNAPQKIVNKKWERVLMHAQSNNPSDWRLAIIEADIMLDELLDVQGYRGETIGDKMKGIEKSDFLTLDQAWDAHKVRNLIAHEGSSFVLTEREARRVIDLYKTVFEEFKFI